MPYLFPLYADDKKADNLSYSSGFSIQPLKITLLERGWGEPSYGNKVDVINENCCGLRLHINLFADDLVINEIKEIV